MPSKPPRLGQRAPQAKQQRLPDLREGSHKRGYDATWHRMSKMVRMEEPLCRHCLRDGRVTAATLVDHIVPLSLSPELRLDRGNLQALCSRCHSFKTQADLKK